MKPHGTLKAAVSALSALSLAIVLHPSSTLAQAPAASGAGWKEYSAATFQEARQGNKPILLWGAAPWSYSSRSMEAETLSAAKVQTALRDWLPVRVDVTERPEVALWMQEAYSRCNQKPGAYPLTIFVTPDGAPFEALGYIPPDSAPDRMGLADIAEKLATLWKTSPDTVRDYGRKVDPFTTACATITEQSFTQADILDLARKAAVAPKLPGSNVALPVAARFVAVAGATLNDANLKASADTLLNSTMRGPQRDHILGGYFRAVRSGPPQIVVEPEKLLSVQAAWLRAFAAGAQATGKPRYKEACREVLRCVRGTLELKDGGWAAWQASGAGLDDGTHFRWTPEQVRTVLGTAREKEAKVILQYLGIKPGPASVGCPTGLLEPIASSLGISYNDANAALDTARQALAKARAESPGAAPLADYSVTAWDASMVLAYLEAASVLEDPTLKEFALQSATRLKARALRSDRSVFRILPKTGDGRESGIVEDYATLAEMLAACSLATNDPAWAESARGVLTKMDEIFGEGEKRELYAQRIPVGSVSACLPCVFDGDLPSANAAAARAWALLARHSGKPDDAERARRLVALALSAQGAPAARKSGIGLAGLESLAAPASK